MFVSRSNDELVVLTFVISLMNVPFVLYRTTLVNDEELCCVSGTYKIRSRIRCNFPEFLDKLVRQVICRLNLFKR